MKHPTFRSVPGTIALWICANASTFAAPFESPPPEIVSAWKVSGENTVVVFRYDGSYYFIQGDTQDPGMERGTFTWDKTTQAFSAQAVVDTNGEGGLSHPEGATTVSITGNTLSYTAVGEGTFTLTRTVNTASAIVGSWIIPGEKFSVTFLADNTYYLCEETNDVPFGFTGIEKGTYTWNSTSKAFTATATIDTNGDVGLNGITSGVTMNVTGNSLVFTDSEGSTTFLRITTNATPLRQLDFGAIRYANYYQSSSSDPSLRAYDPANINYPYSADAMVEPAVAATAPTWKIGSGTPIPIEEDEPGRFQNESGFATLPALNSFVPASTVLQFKSGTATANLSTPASLTFPSTPKIITRGGASWSGGVYSFGDDELLQWTLPTGFVASQFLTEIEVYDPDADEDVVHVDLHGDVTFFDFSGILDPGKEYEIELEFLRVDASNTGGTGVFSGKQGHILSAASTLIDLESLPDDSQQPLIYEQPETQLGTPGSPLFIQVGINEEAFRSSLFQWYKNGQPVTGQTGNSLYIPSFSVADDSGRYKVIVTNDKGTAESEIAEIGTVGTGSQHVEQLVSYKRKISTQGSASLLTASGASFDARVEGPGLTGTFPASSITLTKPDNSSIPLALDGDHWDAESDFANFEALQSGFPDGSYRINIGDDSIAINLSGSNYPNQPLVTASAGTWVGGKLRITASQAAAGFTLTSNASTGDGYVTLAVIDTNTDEDIIYEQANTQPSDPDFVTANVTPNLLTVGKSYEVEVEFDGVVDFTALDDRTWGAPPTGTASAFGLLSTTTVLTIEVVADTTGTPYSDWQQSFFNSSQLADPGISGDEVDFDNDGIDNLLEFVLGGSPTSANQSLVRSATTTPAPGGRNLVFYYDRKTVANAITQVIETSPSLKGTWTSAVHGVNGVVISTSTLDGQTERVTATIPGSETKLFVRIRASR